MNDYHLSSRFLLRINLNSRNKPGQRVIVTHILVLEGIAL